MNARVNLNVKKDLLKYGAKDWNECFHCGNCTAICPLTDDNSLFPRRAIRLAQMGLKDKIKENVVPWLCYYCGDCSKTCPRNANPGELMMSLRRYLISLYDWTGISRLVYTSKKFELIAIVVIAIFVMILYINFTVYPAGDPNKWLGEDGGVLINNMAHWRKIHLADLIMAGLLSFFLITNIINMWYHMILKDKTVKVNILDYIKGLYLLPLHFITQKRFSKCDESVKTYWYIHLLLVIGYVTMFTMIVGFLEWFQTDKVHPFWHPQRLFGYIATVFLFLGIIYFYYNRRKKLRENSKYSHHTDWAFLVLLFLTVLTGILMHYFRISGMPKLTYITYLLHLMIAVPMLVIEVPFSKWSHLAYRPFAIYFSYIKNLAYKRK
ncbi:MAG: 4Fe-4S dicluster domain-containing protein [Bacteroidales bacterium]|nr:4Fe-4S dicluster domain-containing protein [Bacteroidales bacterium]